MELTDEARGPADPWPVPCEKAEIPTYGLGFDLNLVDSSFFTSTREPGFSPVPSSVLRINLTRLFRARRLRRPGKGFMAKVDAYASSQD